jgi:hypothetical protein
MSWKLVVALTLIVTIVYVAKNFTRWTMTSNMMANRRSNTPVVQIDSVEWRGVFVPPGMKIIAAPIQRDIYWEVRINRDPSRVHVLPPLNSPNSTKVNFGDDIRFAEWRVHVPRGLEVKFGEIGYQLSCL